MSKRISGSRLQLWLFMDADRWLVAVLLAGTVFATIMGLGLLDPVSLPTVMANADPAETLFQALTGAIITCVTLVVTLTQLVLSQELGPVGDQRQRMQDAMDFREASEDIIGVPVAPPEPAGYLRALLGASQSHAERLKALAAGTPDADAGVRDYAGRLADHARQVQADLQDAQFGSFDVLSAALDYNYSWKIYEARVLRAEHAGALSDEVDQTLDDLLDLLRLFGPAREHFKTLYFEWALIDLSRGIIYAALPALMASIGGLLYLGSPQHLVGTTLGIDTMTWIVSVAVTFSLMPFTLLLAYILRIATVAKRTLAIGPFVLRETGQPAGAD